MRAAIALTLVGSLTATFAACGSKGESGAAAAAREAAELAAKETANHEAAPTMRAPVADGVHLACSQVLDAAKLTAALGELVPVTITDTWNANKETAAACSIRRGGVPPTPAEQAATLKKQARLGVLPGDEICYVQAICSRMETAEHFRASCKPKGFDVEESLDTAACRQVVAVGADDVHVFHIFDPDTKCVIKVGGGPSNVNNDLTRTCAKTAMTLIGPDQIKGGETPPPPGAGSAGLPAAMAPAAGSGA